MMVAANHATSLAGTWPQATSLVATMTSITGVILATIAAWDAGHRTLSYQRATATSALRALTVITGPAVLCALVTFLSIAAVTSLAVLSVDTGGHPWWLTILSSLMWLIMCAVAGTATGYAIHRPSLAAVTALLASILCVISSMKARENGWLPPPDIPPRKPVRGSHPPTSPVDYLSPDRQRPSTYYCDPSCPSSTHQPAMGPIVWSCRP